MLSEENDVHVPSLVIEKVILFTRCLHKASSLSEISVLSTIFGNTRVCVKVLEP